MTSDVAEVVRRYYAVVADLGSTEEELAALMAPDVRIVERPNAITPSGADRGLDETLAGFRTGKLLLAEQSFDVHEVVVDGGRAAVRATWAGVVGVDNPRIPKGTRLVSHIAAFVRVREGLIEHLETFDCYEPF
jgi:ketosteroid isomerase-like protein